MFYLPNVECVESAELEEDRYGCSDKNRNKTETLGTVRMHAHKTNE